MDNLDRRLLDIIQTDFPLESRPYAVLAEKLGISEEEAFQRVRSLRKDGIIRRIGANFQSARLGWVSTLCAAKVPAEKMEEFISRVNAETGVTHNYEREHPYNIWFTLISPSIQAQLDTINAITRDTGISILNLPATRLYKIRVDFSMSE